MSALLSPSDSPLTVDEEYRLPSAATETVREELRSGLLETVDGLKRDLETTTFRLLASVKYSAEFRDLRQELFPRYVHLNSAISSVMLAEVSKAVLHDLVPRAFSYLEKKFSEQTLLALSEDARDEISFCLSTFRRTYRLIPAVMDVEVLATCRKQDRELASKFASAMFWSQLHLDCLRYAVRNGIVPSDEVLHELLVGLRVVVMAYAYIREAMDLRKAESESLEHSRENWDEEDQALAAQSTDERESLLEA